MAVCPKFCIILHGCFYYNINRDKEVAEGLILMGGAAGAGAGVVVGAMYYRHLFQFQLLALLLVVPLEVLLVEFVVVYLELVLQKQ